MIVEVRAHPGASKARVAWDGKAIHAWVTASPHEGKANEAVAELVAAALGVPRSRVELLRGARGRSKVFRIEGGDAGALGRLPGLTLD